MDTNAIGLKAQFYIVGICIVDIVLIPLYLCKATMYTVSIP
jgi:hypothetical protein